MKKGTKNLRREATAVCLLIAILLTSWTASGAASEQNVQYPHGVTEAMCHADYWIEKADNADEIMMTPREINAFNTLAAHTKETYVLDLEEVPTVYDASALKDALTQGILKSKKDRALFVDGKQIDNDAYFAALSGACADTAWTGSREIGYGVCTRQTNLMSIPTNDVIGYSLTDADSEYQDSALNVNDPVVIKQVCSYDDRSFYYVESDHCPGWVDAQSVAVCAGRGEWLDAWKTSADSQDILVVTQNRIVTEPSIFVPETADVKLTIGTTLKLVPEDKIPEKLGERYAWNNYVVYLPTRDADGGYVRREALISQHYSVSIGFLPMTQANILRTAFTCLGDRYGWGGMLDAMDCSMFTRNVYRCFGLQMPRNTTWQQLVPNTKIDLSGMTDAQKLALLQNTPAGALLYFPGHTMIYTGFDADTGYVVSALGSASDSTGELNVRSIYSVALNPLTVRRRSGNTWLTDLTAIVIPANYAQKKYDPSISPEDVCALCGKVHTGAWGRVVQAIHKVVCFILRLFGVRRTVGAVGAKPI